MFQKSQSSPGFTLIEIVVSIALLVLISGFLMTGFQNYASYQRYNQAVGDTLFILNQVRTDARSAIDDEAKGIKFTSNTMTEFSGDIYSAIDPDNVVTTFKLVTLATNLTGGVDEIVFDKLTGIPSATGTVVVTGTVFSASTTITISNTGIVE